MFRNRHDVTEAIIVARIRKELSWEAVSQTLGRSKSWATAACLGQMAFTAEDAEKIVALFDLDASAKAWLMIPPDKGTLAGGAPHDPLLYRWYEMLSVYGPAIRELTHEEFGDGIMSAIDFRMAIEREADPAGDRVKVTLSGKFLPYTPQ